MFSKIPAPIPFYHRFQNDYSSQLPEARLSSIYSLKLIKSACNLERSKSSTFQKEPLLLHGYCYLLGCYIMQSDSYSHIFSRNMLAPPSQILVNLYPTTFQKTDFFTVINMHTAILQYIMPNFREYNPPSKASHPYEV